MVDDYEGFCKEILELRNEVEKLKSDINKKE